MKRTRMFSLLVAIVLVLSMVACSSSANTPADTQSSASTSAPTVTTAVPAATSKSADNAAITPTTIIYADDAGETSLRAKIAIKLEEILTKKSGGKIIMQRNHGTLGNVEELTESIQNGSIDMLGISMGSAQGPEFSVLDLPVVYSLVDFNKLTQVFRSGKFHDMLSQRCEAKNMKMLFSLPFDFRELTSNKQINKFEDLKGLKIRTPTNTIYTKTWEYFGATPTPIAFPEAYMAMQQGVVDAHENPYNIIAANAFYEVQKYLVYTHHLLNQTGMFYNLDKWNSLTAADQKVILESAAEAEEWSVKAGAEMSAADKQTCLDNGMIPIDPDQEFRDKMYAAVVPLIKYVRENAGDEIVDELLTELGQDTNIGK